MASPIPQQPRPLAAAGSTQPDKNLDARRKGKAGDLGPVATSGVHVEAWMQRDMDTKSGLWHSHHFPEKPHHQPDGEGIGVAEREAIPVPPLLPTPFGPVQRTTHEEQFPRTQRADGQGRLGFPRFSPLLGQGRLTLITGDEGLRSRRAASIVQLPSKLIRQLDALEPQSNRAFRHTQQTVDLIVAPTVQSAPDDVRLCFALVQHSGAGTQTCTGHTALFRRVLYYLSYPGK